MASCQTTSKISQGTIDKGLNALAEMMTGYFNSAKQAAFDSAYFDISLTMKPIWPGDNHIKWLYVEQAVTANIKQPYRQRIYRLSLVEQEKYESRVYELPDPDRFIHAWENNDIFDTISQDSLISRQGCSVYLQRSGSCFTGSTHEDDCKSSLRGASYASSTVEICPDKITSWDQGWDDQGKQVWGAAKGGYVFVKQKD